MKMDEGMRQKVEEFLAKYPGKIEFSSKTGEFKEAHGKLFELVEYVLKQGKNLTPEDEKFKSQWDIWKQSGLASKQTITTVKRHMSLSAKGGYLNSYMKKMSKFPALNKFVSLEYATEPQPLMTLKNKLSTKPVSTMKQNVCTCSILDHFSDILHISGNLV